MRNWSGLRGLVAGVALAASVAIAAPASAGPYILAGTDADDHGFSNGTANVDGWLFMQRALENLGPAVTNGNKVVVALGSDPSTTAGDAAASAFGFSNLVGAGWTFVNINSVASITDFFNGVGATNITNTGIIMLDSSDLNVFGGIDTSEQAVVTANASALNNFLGLGGGLFSQANEYGFLSALITGAQAIDESNTGLALTAQGNAAFPGLTDADLSSGPYHESFANFGSIPVLATSTVTGNPVIIGSSGGSITNPDPIPEPMTLALFAGGLLGLGVVRGRSRKG